MRVYHSIEQYAVQEYHIHGTHFTMPKAEKKQLDVLSSEERKKLEQYLLQTGMTIDLAILLCLFTGLRVGELYSLQWNDIDFENGTLSVKRTVQRIYRNGSSEVLIGSPKSRTSARTIPVPSLLMNIIKKFYTDNPNHYFLTGKTKPTEPRTYRQFFSRFLKRNELEKVKFHETRHTFAVRAIEMPEFDIKSLSEILGHKNVSFTLNVYGSANLQQKTKCMNLLNDLL